MIMLTNADNPFISGNKLESDNDDYVRQTSCDHCQVNLTPRQIQFRNRFCSHLCYCHWMRARAVEPRFWKYVSKTPTCWNWTGPKTGSGRVRYGQFMWSAKYRTPQKAHRVAWELAFGPIPSDRQINHRCDNPICVRLDHLYLGTQLQNMQDAAKKSRLSVPRERTLSLFDRLTIYHAKGYRGIVRDLAAQYHVTKACISVIRLGRFLGSGVWHGTKQVRESA